MSFEEIVNQIVEKTGISREEIIKRINKKIVELSGLLTKEGAAMLVGREFGIEIIRKPSLKIKDIDFGMKGFNLEGRVFKISNIVEFERIDGSKGRVVNLYIADETGFVRVPLWNDQVDFLEKEKIKVGDCVQIINGIARENIFGNLEISLGKFGRIIKTENENLPSLEKILNEIFPNSIKRVKIKDIVSSGLYEIKGVIVHVFKGNYIFNVCPICNQRIEGNYCKEHGEVDPLRFLVISTIIDDGTSTLRTVFFRDQAEKLVGIKAEELLDLDANERKNLIESRILGREVVVRGRVKQNKVFGNLEFIVNELKDLNYLEETKKLVEVLKNE